MKEKKISHIGKVVDLGPDYVKVQFIRHSACGECHAKGLCAVSEDEVKEVLMPQDPLTPFALGEEVNVEMSRSLGYKAVWLCYLVPLLVFLVAMFTSSKWPGASLSELAVGGISLGCVAIYYLALALMKNRLADEYCFTIHKLS